MKNCYVDIHVLQTVPASCINRDDTGSPKTMIYGGTMRARVSSQAWKHAMRVDFKNIMTADQIGIRTRTPAGLVAEELKNLKPELEREKAVKMAEEALAVAGAKGDGKDVMFFISLPQARAVADIIVKGTENKEGSGKKGKENDTKKALEHALNDNPSVDMVMFGRMAAANPSLNYDAACQVAHSVSTHTISNEYDYFTAVDDLSDDEGAGHLGTVEFNSSTLYRYATVNVNELKNHIDKETVSKVVRAFVKSFAVSMPTGKQNTFANRNLPNLIYVTVRNDQPINLAGAFEKPVKAGTDGFVEKSILRLADFAEDLYKDYDAAPERAWCIGSDNTKFGKRVSFETLLTGLEEYIRTV